MPRGDRRGPNGEGSMTGRGLGYCAGNDAPGFAYPGPGAGGMRRGLRGAGYMSRARARGRDFRWNGPGFRRGAPGEWGAPVSYGAPYAPPPSAAEERRWLEGDLEYLKQELKATEERINELKEKSEE